MVVPAAGCCPGFRAREAEAVSWASAVTEVSRLHVLGRNLGGTWENTLMNPNVNKPPQGRRLGQTFLRV